MSVTFFEPQKELPLLADADVVVVGGGPGGMPAAIAAARAGHSTILVERYGVLGGTVSSCLMGGFIGFAPTAPREENCGKERVPESECLLGGIPKEFVERAIRMGAAPPREKISWDAVAADPEVFKIVCDSVCREAGVDILFHTMAVGVIAQGGHIQGIIVEGKSGRKVITGRVFIDASADGDIAYHAGAPYEKGREADGLTQPMGTRFLIGGVREVSWEEQLRGDRLVSEAIAAGRIRCRGYDAIQEFGACIRKGEMSPNVVRVAGDGTNILDLTRGELAARKDTYALLQFLKENVPGYRDAYILNLPFAVGVRETRRIKGEYTLRDEDILNMEKHPETSVARGCYMIDIHCPRGFITHERAFKSLCTVNCLADSSAGEACYMKSKYRNQLSPIQFLKEHGYFGIPYGCLLPQNVDNLLVSGRCISASHWALSSVRVVGTSMAIGEACGSAASLALEKGCTPKQVRAAEVQHRLSLNNATY